MPSVQLPYYQLQLSQQQAYSYNAPKQQDETQISSQSKQVSRSVNKSKMPPLYKKASLDSQQPRSKNPSSTSDTQSSLKKWSCKSSNQQQPPCQLQMPPDTHLQNQQPLILPQSQLGSQQQLPQGGQLQSLYLQQLQQQLQQSQQQQQQNFLYQQQLQQQLLQLQQQHQIASGQVPPQFGLQLPASLQQVHAQANFSPNFQPLALQSQQPVQSHSAQQLPLKQSQAVSLKLAAVPIDNEKNLNQAIPSNHDCSYITNNTSLRSLANQMDIPDAKSQKSAAPNKNLSAQRLTQMKSTELSAKPAQLSQKRQAQIDKLLSGNRADADAQSQHSQGDSHRNNGPNAAGLQANSIVSQSKQNEPTLQDNEAAEKNSTITQAQSILSSRINDQVGNARSYMDQHMKKVEYKLNPAAGKKPRNNENNLPEISEEEGKIQVMDPGNLLKLLGDD